LDATGRGAIGGVELMSIIVVVFCEILWLGVRIRELRFRIRSEGNGRLPSICKACWRFPSIESFVLCGETSGSGCISVGLVSVVKSVKEVLTMCEIILVPRRQRTLAWSALKL
jgi:hypothetical protein